MRSNTRSSVLATTLAFGCLVAVFAGLSRQVAQRPIQEFILKRAEGRDAQDDALPVIRLYRLPRIRLRPRKPVSDEQARHIESCIARLAEVDQPDYGYARTITGVRFLPLPDQTDAFGWTVTNHGVATSDALCELVEIGPDAIPALLRHLDDETPTKLRILPISLSGPESQISLMGLMTYSSELNGNPANPREADLMPRNTSHDLAESTRVREHQLRIGDLCFVALGQIVGRPYMAVRYQQTACVVVNSPVHDRALCDKVRSIWRGSDPVQIVFDSLQRDFVTEESWDGSRQRDDDVLSDYETNAALRLLFYFPQESAGLVADRLKRLRVLWPHNAEAETEIGDAIWEHDRIAHTRRVTEFVKRVSWSPVPVVRREVSRIFRTTTSLEIAIAALPAIAKEAPDAAHRQVLSLLKAANGDFDLYDVIAALVQGFGHKVLVILPDVFRETTPDQLRWFCIYGGYTMSDDNDKVLALLLSDQRLTEPDTKGVTVRVCDAAASALSDLNTKFLFDRTASVGQRDDQIERLRQQFSTESPRSRDGSLRRDKRPQE